MFIVHMLPNLHCLQENMLFMSRFVWKFDFPGNWKADEVSSQYLCLMQFVFDCVAGLLLATMILQQFQIEKNKGIKSHFSLFLDKYLLVQNKNARERSSNGMHENRWQCCSAHFRGWSIVAIITSPQHIICKFCMILLYNQFSRRIGSLY